MKYFHIYIYKKSPLRLPSTNDVTCNTHTHFYKNINKNSILFHTTPVFLRLKTLTHS